MPFKKGNKFGELNRGKKRSEECKSNIKNKFEKGMTPWNKGLKFNRTIVKCEICGKEKSIINSILKSRPGKFCSIKCRNIWFSYMMSIKKCKFCNKEFKDHKGGDKQFCSKKCYWSLMKSLYNSNNGSYKTATSFGRRTYIHRAVMENKIGRKLLKTEIVHHKNFNKNDNRLSNLKIMSQSDHIKIHLIYDFGKRESKP